MSLSKEKRIQMLFVETEIIVLDSGGLETQMNK